MFRIIIFTVFAATGLFAQSWIEDVWIVPSIRNSITRFELKKQAAVYACNAKTTQERGNASSYVMDALGVHRNVDDVGYGELNTEQYEILCELFHLVPNTNNTMLVVYFNQRAVQFPFDTKNINLLQELRTLGWSPLEEHLENFLKDNPQNQEALAVLLARRKNEFTSGESPSPSQFTSVLRAINRAESVDWMGNISVLVAFGSMGTPESISALRGNNDFQRELNTLLASVENEIERDPYQYAFYSHWSTLANMAQNPDPRRILSRIAFPPGSMKVYVDFSLFAQHLFFDGKTNEAFKLLKEIENWMELQDINKGVNFYTAFDSLAMLKITELIVNERFTEVEEYLNGLIIRFGPEWPQYSKEIKNSVTLRLKNGYDIDIQEIPNAKKVNQLFDFPAIDDGKYFNALLLTHNFPKEFYDKLAATLSQKKVHFLAVQDAKLSPNAWTLKNANILVGSGAISTNNDDESDDDLKNESELMELIHREELKYLNALDGFVRQNPNNFAAMNMYCEEASKYLPDETLENKIYAYTAITRNPISVETYSKINNKNNWLGLISKIKMEELARLRNAPFGLINNPWSTLSKWDDLDILRNPVDWYGFLLNSVFCYNPMYYTQSHVMPEDVFVKTLKQAEKAADWNTVTAACTARFMEKQNCKNDWILEAWAEAEEKLKK